jgi:hypothetical protein
LGGAAAAARGGRRIFKGGLGMVVRADKLPGEPGNSGNLVGGYVPLIGGGLRAARLINSGW